MSLGLSELQSSSAFDGFPAGGFFYSNLRIQETLTTIRYGIEARKGMVLIVGEAGVGKTALLHKVAAGLSANVTSIVESDPRVDFTEVLRLMLRSLGVESSGADEQALVHSCQRELRARLEKCQIVALMFDNAHHLSEQTLRHVIKNFLAGSAEDPDGTLLQLVLVGRPELKNNLAQAALFPLRRRTPILCEIQPLNSQEIGPYIETGLRSNDQAEELFDARAVKRIALYTGGNPRAVNAICECAAQVAGRSAGAAVNAELIDDIARDLNFRESDLVTEKTKAEERFETPEKVESSESFQFTPAENYTKVLEAVSHTFLDYRQNEEPQGSFQSNRTQAKRRTAWVSVMLFLIVLGGAGAWVGPGAARDSVTYWRGMLNRVIVGLQVLKPGASESESALEPLAKTGPRDPLPPPAVNSPPLESDQASGATETPPETSIEPFAGNNGAESTLTRDAKSQPTLPSAPNQERRAPLRVGANHRNHDLQLEIIKAIANRAIIGVEVSVIGGTAYLDGRVAAERAAHSVAGVGRVRNRISVN